MHNRRLPLVAALLAGLSTSGGHAAGELVLRPPHQPPATRQRKSSKPKKRRARAYSTNRMPNRQGERECARRRGGQDWAEFKALDRIRRGLPVSWPFQGMEG